MFYNIFVSYLYLAKLLSVQEEELWNQSFLHVYVTEGAYTFTFLWGLFFYCANFTHEYSSYNISG